MKTFSLVAMLLSLLLVSSCQNPFHPPLRDLSSHEILNSSPEEVLRNLERAYKEKNINIFKALLHPDFRFELLSSEVNQIGVDVDGDHVNDSWWGYDKEVEFTTNMFYHGSTDGLYPVADKIDLRLQIPPQDNWQADPEVGHESWIIIPCNFDLILSYNSMNTSYVANGVARFYLRKDEGRWSIAIWRDESLL
ncbi:MAG TPA: hypothetical protein PKI59_05010 [Candidatus Cloacimonadota bacterium]|nr:hypothetical protein [Candidatus Cloacimonadota bacterium]